MVIQLPIIQPNCTKSQGQIRDKPFTSIATTEAKAAAAARNPSADPQDSHQLQPPHTPHQCSDSAEGWVKPGANHSFGAKQPYPIERVPQGQPQQKRKRCLPQLNVELNSHDPNEKHRPTDSLFTNIRINKLNIYEHQSHFNKAEATDPGCSN